MRNPSEFGFCGMNGSTLRIFRMPIFDVQLFGLVMKPDSDLGSFQLKFEMGFWVSSSSFGCLFPLSTYSLYIFESVVYGYFSFKYMDWNSAYNKIQ